MKWFHWRARAEQFDFDRLVWLLSNRARRLSALKQMTSCFSQARELQRKPGACLAAEFREMILPSCR